jgi:lipooligosaccharide transport system ATP-binding protein
MRRRLPQNSAMPPEFVITLRDLCKQFADVQAVNQLSLNIPAGKCFGLLGPNGAGKSTTLKMMLGLSTPTSGEIEVLGYRVPAQASQMRMRVGVVPQSDMLDPDFTVAENLLVYGRYFGLTEALLNERIDPLVEFAGLSSKRNNKISELSGGMKRRLTLARALINDPEILFLDEPSTGLDPQARHLIWERLKQLLEMGKTIVLTTHFMDEAQRLCDELVIIEKGKLIAHGSPEQMIRECIEPQVMELRGAPQSMQAAHQSLQSNEHWVRCERFGDTTYAYTADPHRLQTLLATVQGLTTVSRPANLEDVFLRLTGRELRD